MYDATEKTLHNTFNRLLRFVLVVILLGADPRKQTPSQRGEAKALQSESSNGGISSLKALSTSSIFPLHAVCHPASHVSRCALGCNFTAIFLGPKLLPISDYLFSLLHQRTYQPLDLLEQGMKQALTSRTTHCAFWRGASPPWALRT